MKKLIDGIIDFRKRILPTCQEKFTLLAKGQNPDVLFITCSDSRVAPNWFASTDPGDLFVVRNVGNLVPPSVRPDETPQIGGSVLAAAEFSLLNLNVSHIVVCGHSECGAMNALLSSKESERTPHIRAWLTFGEPALQKFKQGFCIDPTLSPINQLSQVNVLQQIEHLRSYPLIQKQIQKRNIQIHGWWFDIAKADVFSYQEDRGRFQLIE